MDVVQLKFAIVGDEEEPVKPAGTDGGSESTGNGLVVIGTEPDAKNDSLLDQTHPPQYEYVVDGATVCRRKQGDPKL